MPKKQPKNAFFFFMLDFKRKEENRGRRFPNGMADVSSKASPFWNKMTPQEKGPYEKQAKDAKVAGQAGALGERYTSQGIAFSELDRQRAEVERAEANMHRDINQMVKDSYLNNTIATQEYVFIAGNYFCKTMSNVYVPAELALLKYNLDKGFSHKYHTYVNPGQLPAGYAFEAKDYSRNNHQLPPPPNAMGERSYTKILTGVLNFLGVKKCKELPPLFTDVSQVAIIKSIIQQLCLETDEDPSNFRIFPLAQLFYVLKGEVCKFALDDRDAFQSIHIAQAMIDRDQYDYRQDISCNYHDEVDASKYCALSLVIRWSFIFSDHICIDLGIELIPGKHIPLDSDVKIGIKLKEELEVSRSFLSKPEPSEVSFVGSDTTTYTQPQKWLTEDVSTDFSVATAVDPNEEFPTIAGSSSRHRNKKMDHEAYYVQDLPAKTAKYEMRDENPWVSRNSSMAREPHNESLNFSVGGRGRLDYNKVKTEPAAPRGRGKFQ